MSDGPTTGSYRLTKEQVERLSELYKKSEGGGQIVSVNQRDWLAISVAIVSIATQIGAWVWWGGRMSQRMDTIEEWRRAEEIRAGTSSTIINSQAADLAVVRSQVQDIKSWVDRQESRR